MMNELIEKKYELAKRHYAEFGIDTEHIIKELLSMSLSVHCWQADDVGGFETPDAEISGGGIQATGNYPGKARTIEEARQDYEKVFSLVPGNHRLALHASYGEFGGTFVDRNEIRPKHFSSWIEWAKKNDIKLDMNCTLFSHPKAADGFTLSSKSDEVRSFWIEHVKQVREISAEIGKELNDCCVHNIWIPDGMKDIPVDKAGHRLLLKESLDEILEHRYPETQMIDSVEGKLFGIGSEAFVVGSNEFYLSYALSNDIHLTMDTGHYHPTESVADKISAVMPFLKGLLLHVSRGVRWDSDHVVIINDEILQLMEEIVRSPSRSKIRIALDFFDASINRIGAYVIGIRATQKALLRALLQPLNQLKELEESGKYFQRLALLEELKSLPFGAVWDYLCLKHSVPTGNDWIKEVERYEEKVLRKRWTFKHS